MCPVVSIPRNPTNDFLTPHSPIIMKKSFPYIILALLTVLLVAAGFVEYGCGTEVAHRWWYAAPWTIALWALAAVTGLWWVWRRRRQVGLPGLLLHAALALILVGALLTHCFSRGGTVELVEGAAPVDGYLTAEGGVGHFPFSVRLLSCESPCYTGTQTASDYVSHVEWRDTDGTTGRERIAMNVVMRHRGWRFYQTGMRPGVSTLTVSYDPWGIGVTYAGYALLLLGWTATLLRPGGGFRRLLRSPLLRRTSLCAALLLAGAASAVAETVEAEPMPRVLQPGVAKTFGRLYVHYNGRICPMQTLARDCCLKLTGASSYRGMTAEQVLTGFLFYYEDWRGEPLVRIKDKAVAEYLGATDGRACLADFYAPSGYKLAKAPEQLSRRAVQEADEQCRLMEAVATGALFEIYPCRTGSPAALRWLSWVDALPQDLSVEDRKFIRGSMAYVAECLQGGRNRAANEALLRIRDFQESRAGADGIPSPQRFRAELLLNRMGQARPVALVCVVLGLISYVVQLRRLRQSQPTPAPQRMDRAARWLSWAALAIAGAWTVVVLTLRGIVGGYFPVSNGFETLLFMAALVFFGALLGRRRWALLPAFGLLLGGLALVVAGLGQRNPPVGHLMPVLSSSLLSLHVAAVMAGYALLGLIALNGATALLLTALHRWRSGQGEEERSGATAPRGACVESGAGVRMSERMSVRSLAAVSRLLLYPAVWFLGVGIFLGAVWANQSWGSYWSWDPKETWALVTLLIYALPLHSRSLGVFRRPLLLHAYLLGAFLSVLMTYFGVNFLLGGMHSYA